MNKGFAGANRAVAGDHAPDTCIVNLHLADQARAAVTEDQAFTVFGDHQMPAFQLTELAQHPASQ